MPSRTPTPHPTPTARFQAAVDLVSWREAQGGGWFEQPLSALPAAILAPDWTFTVSPDPLANRRAGAIAPTLVSGYVFLQFGEVTPALFARHANTVGALFIRSALLSFVDYANNRVLDWDRQSSEIPMDIRGMIRAANERGLPVYLGINYSDYVPGPNGTGVEALQKADSVAATIGYLQALQDEGLQVTGVTFGDEIGDEAGFGAAKPTLANDDLMERYLAYARALKTAFPTLQIYAFDSYIAATRGQTASYMPLLRAIRTAELGDRRALIDGFIFRESYTYMDESGVVRPSQQILDDTESLFRNAPVHRYDVMGQVSSSWPDRDYLHLLLTETERIFGRPIVIGLSEYLPAGPVQLSESDTSPYDDQDFLLHYADVVGIYAELGLDAVATWMFANETQQAECYIDKEERAGRAYPVHLQLAQRLRGTALQVVRPAPYEQLRVKVYAARDGDRLFLMILNKDAAREQEVRIVLPGELDLALRLPARSYTGVVSEADTLTVTGIGP